MTKRMTTFRSLDGGTEPNMFKTKGPTRERKRGTMRDRTVRSGGKEGGGAESEGRSEREGDGRGGGEERIEKSF